MPFDLCYGTAGTALVCQQSSSFKTVPELGRQQPEEPAIGQHSMRASRHGHAHLEECLLQALLSLQTCLQDFKLNVLDWHLLPQLGSLLLDMSLMLGATNLVDHYLRDLGPSAAGAASRKGEPRFARVT